MWKLPLTLNKNLFIAKPVMLLLSFGCGVLCDTAALKHAIVPLTFLMVYPMMVTLKVRRVFQRGDRRAQWLAQAIKAFGPQGAGAALVVALSYVVQVQAAAWVCQVHRPDLRHGGAGYSRDHRFTHGGRGCPRVCDKPETARILIRLPATNLELACKGRVTAPWGNAPIIRIARPVSSA